MMNLSRYNIEAEKKTVKVMIAMYCSSHHNTGNRNMCDSCNELSEYAILRIDNY